MLGRRTLVLRLVEHRIVLWQRDEGRPFHFYIHWHSTVLLYVVVPSPRCSTSSVDGGTITSSGFPSSWLSGIHTTCRVFPVLRNIWPLWMTDPHKLPLASSRSFGIDLLTDCAFASLRLRLCALESLFGAPDDITFFGQTASCMLRYRTEMFFLVYCGLFWCVWWLKHLLWC